MGLDENLPSFYLADSKDGVKHEHTYLHARGGLDPEPAYILKHPDPSSPTAQNCYAAALFDAYSPEILYGEVLINPNWTQPTLSQEEIRKNGGIPPPPEPTLPTGFTIQLYNPELQIEVKREQSMLGSTHYDFSLPQDTFRMPSGSMLDRTQHDPAASGITPKIHFSFKREGKLSKDMVLCMKGRSTDIVHKKKSKEPDISLALFKALREITIYEPNLVRVDLEDPKGLEVVVLLVATVIRDVYYGQLRQAFNVTDNPRRRSSTNTKDNTATLKKDPNPPTTTNPALMSGGLQSHAAAANALYDAPPNPATKPPPRQPGEPITDPRTQWSIDAETARLKAAADAEASEKRRADDARRRDQARRDEAESKRLMKQLEAEEKERRRREREVEKETERLRKIYGTQAQNLSPPPRGQAHSAPVPQGPFPQPQQRPSPQPLPQQRPQAPVQAVPVHARPGYPSHPQQAPQAQAQTGLRPANANANSRQHAASFGALNAGASVGNLLNPSGGHGGKRSMWNLRSKSEEQGRLTKKTSSVW